MHFESTLRSNIIAASKDLSRNGVEFATFKSRFAIRTIGS